MSKPKCYITGKEFEGMWGLASAIRNTLIKARLPDEDEKFLQSIGMARTYADMLKVGGEFVEIVNTNEM